ncbi:MAG: response regulator [Mariprofundaceae bacterium]
MYRTTGEAARICGVSINTIKNWIRRGRLEAVRTPGGHWRIPAAALDAFLTRLRTENAMQDEGIAPEKSRILIVDDDPAAHELIRGILDAEMPGCAVHSAFDGSTGLIEIGLLRPHLIVLDIMMPGIHGLEIIQRLKGPDSLLPGARIIAVTAATDRRLVIDRIREAGPDALLFKPLDARAFVAAARRVLDRGGAPADADLLMQGGGI